MLSTLSYAGAILPHMLTGRKTIVPGPFHLGGWGWAVNGVSLVYIAVMVVFFCFPFVMPVAAGSMNYTSAIVGGLVLVITGWWFVHGRGNYQGPVRCSFCDGVVGDWANVVDRNILGRRRRSWRMGVRVLFERGSLEAGLWLGGGFFFSFFLY